MTTFAVTSTDQTLDAVNYLLSNLNQTGNVGNATIPTGTLIGNTTSGIVSTYNAGGGNAYSYLYQYINLRYANNATGTSGFSTLPGNANFFGVYNSATSAASSVPAAYTYYEVAGGFGTTKTIFYSTQGGRQIQLVPANVAPSSSFVQSTANTAIDLDVVTTAAGTPGSRGPIAMAYVVTPSTPVGASDLQLTAWWEAARDSLTPPIGTGLTPVTGDTGTFIYGAGVGTPSETYEFNGSGWNEVVPQVISGNVIVGNSLPGSSIVPESITGSRIANVTITGNLYALGSISGDRISTNTIEANNIAGDTITGNKVAANTIAAYNIQTNTITATQIAANTITAGQIAVGTITGDKVAANTIVATNIQTGTITANQIATGTITATQIAAGTITATQIAADYLYTGNIISTGATLGSNTSTGYWLRHSDGAARFGGSVSIGNSAVIGGNLTVGANLSVVGLVTSGSLNANTVATTTIVPSAVSLGTQMQTSSPYTQSTPTSGVTYYDTQFSTVTTVEANQSVYLYAQVLFNLYVTVTTASAIRSNMGLYRRNSAGAYTLLRNYVFDYGTVSPGTAVASSEMYLVGYLDTVPTAGTYNYVFGFSWQRLSGLSLMTQIILGSRNILSQSLKR